MTSPLPLAIEHITLTTGAARMSPRSEVPDDAVRAVRAAMARGGRLLDWRIQILADCPSDVAYDLVHDAAGPMVRCYLCRSMGASARLWEEITADVQDERVILARPKGAIWLAGRILQLRISQAHVGAMMEAGDLSRIVAWAMIEGKTGK